MDTRLIFRNTVTGLSFCAIGVMGGWHGHGHHADSHTTLHAPYTHLSGIAKTDTADEDRPVPASTPWDSTGWTGRIVVGEYVTGTFCSGCQAHEYAFDAMIKRYPPTAFIALAYHGVWNLPISDPVDSLWERIYAWYGLEGAGLKGGPPSIFPREKGWDNWIDGHPTAEGGITFGPPQSLLSKIQYDAMIKATDADLHKAPEAVLHAQATPKGSTIVAHVKVESLSSPHSDVYVRMLVVEDTVRLIMAPDVPGTARLDHYMVVRSAARTAKYSLGLPLHGPGTVAYTFDLAKTQKRRLQHKKIGLAKLAGTVASNENEDLEKNLTKAFPDDKNWKMDTNRLHLVAFVQDAHTGDVLQAQMIPVNGKLLKLP